VKKWSWHSTNTLIDWDGRPLVWWAFGF